MIHCGRINEVPVKDDLLAIQTRFACDCRHQSTSVVNERIAGKSWCGRIEIWTLVGSAPAPFCYGWRKASGDVMTVLQILPVFSPSTAVRAALAQEEATRFLRDAPAKIGRQSE